MQLKFIWTKTNYRNIYIYLKGDELKVDNKTSSKVETEIILIQFELLIFKNFGMFAQILNDFFWFGQSGTFTGTCFTGQDTTNRKGQTANSKKSLIC